MKDIPSPTRVLSIRLTTEMAEQVETLAETEQRTVSELFEEAFRNYRAQCVAAAFAELDRVGQTRNTNPFGYTEADVERVVDEIRQELAAERNLMQPQASRG